MRRRTAAEERDAEEDGEWETDGRDQGWASHQRRRREEWSHCNQGDHLMHHSQHQQEEEEVEKMEKHHSGWKHTNTQHQRPSITNTTTNDTTTSTTTTSTTITSTYITTSATTRQTVTDATTTRPWATTCIEWFVIRFCIIIVEDPIVSRRESSSCLDGDLVFFVGVEDVEKTRSSTFVSELFVLEEHLLLPLLLCILRESSSSSSFFASTGANNRPLQLCNTLHIRPTTLKGYATYAITQYNVISYAIYITPMPWY